MSETVGAYVRGVAYVRSWEEEDAKLLALRALPARAMRCKELIAVNDDGECVWPASRVSTTDTEDPGERARRRRRIRK